MPTWPCVNSLDSDFLLCGRVLTMLTRSPTATLFTVYPSYKKAPALFLRSIQSSVYGSSAWYISLQSSTRSSFWRSGMVSSGAPELTIPTSM
jgi:hypothetical protein